MAVDDLTSASSWCSTSSLGVRPRRLHNWDFTMIGKWPRDCLTMPLGTPLTDQLMSAWEDVRCVPWNVSFLETLQPMSDITYHQLPFVRTSSPSTLCWIDIHLTADGPFGHHGFEDGGFHEGKADYIIFHLEFQRPDGLKDMQKHTKY